MLRPSARGGILMWSRFRIILLTLLVCVSTYYLLFSDPAPHFNIVPYTHGPSTSKPQGELPISSKQVKEGIVKQGEEHMDEQDEKGEYEKLPPNMDARSWKKELKMLRFLNLTLEELREWRDPNDRENPDEITEGYETDGNERDSGSVAHLRYEKDMRKMWRYVHQATANRESSNKIYGQTLTTLDFKNDRSKVLSKKLRPDSHVTVGFAIDKPVRFVPYPDYNSHEWKKQRYAPYTACKGPSGDIVEDLLVFKGRPHEFPEPKIGSYGVLGLDLNICWERTTRLGSVGVEMQIRKDTKELQLLDWDNVNWGDLQRQCVDLNAGRFEMNRAPHNQFQDHYPELAKPATPPKQPQQGVFKADSLRDVPRIKGRSPVDSQDRAIVNSRFKKEKRTAVLLRSYTGKTYTRNDKQNIRALISEVSLRTGGEYEVFLLVHVKDQELHPFDDPQTYQKILQEHIPREFHGITVLWNDQQVWDIYDKMTDQDEKSVHAAQWLSVQKFSHDHPQFDFIWNWEMDFRFTGHHYDLLDNLQKFAAKQPRRGLWERSERWYIPEYHGDYDTKFRKSVEQQYGNETVWGAPELPFIKPVGPRPPVATPEQDDYHWGVGEDADYIGVSPIFNPVHSNWIIRDGVWGYSDANHRSQDLPRRSTIVTQSRLSKRLLDVMHIENKRGNHVASEMTPQTVALLHGLKAVFAPQPVFMDRDWGSEFVNDWLNPGPKGESGGYGSPMGWGRERRYQGNTWYYRAEPPNRLYNNWMGWVDTNIGGEEWEQSHGRPCLPSIMLHPVKDTNPTKKGHRTEYDLFFG